MIRNTHTQGQQVAEARTLEAFITLQGFQLTAYREYPPTVAAILAPEDKCESSTRCRKWVSDT